MKLTNIILPSAHPPPSGPPKTYDIDISEHKITDITPSMTDPTTSPPSLLLPTLCHPHIHLDKAYLLTCHHHSTSSDHPDYSDLSPQSGTFPEALSNTAAAKSRFTPSDLLLRGRQLLATSYTQGVTSARCFVEVDHVTRFKTLDAGLQLKREFADLVRVQLCAFAQDPVFSTEHGEANRRLMEEALDRHANLGANNDDSSGSRDIEVLGSTPYVETSRKASIQNIEWAITTALKHGLHLDFHLDYNLDESQTRSDLLIWEVINQLQAHNWPTLSPSSSTTKGRRLPRTVAIGHSTALTVLSHASLQHLAETIHKANLPISFVGLPTSDIYMMGRPSSSPSSPSSPPSDKAPLHRPRGTLNPVVLEQTYGLRACLGVNNVGNAFTPYGTGDPLELASWGVGMYHAGTREGALGLLGAVSWGARRAVGLEDSEDEGEDKDEDEGKGKSEPKGKGEAEKALTIRQGQDISAFGLLCVRNEAYIGIGKGEGQGELEQMTSMTIPARQRWHVRDVVWDVPRVELRSVVR